MGVHRLQPTGSIHLVTKPPTTITPLTCAVRLPTISHMICLVMTAQRGLVYRTDRRMRYALWQSKDQTSVYECLDVSERTTTGTRGRMRYRGNWRDQ